MRASLMEVNHPGRLFQTLSILVTLVSVCCIPANAQSGRRGSSKTVTTPTPSVSGPKEVEAKPQKPARLRLLVGIEDPGPFSNVPYYLTDIVLSACIQRLNEATDVFATAPAQRITHADALKTAKAEKERYVVWLKLGSDITDSGRQVRNNADEIYVNYVIFEPVTAKVKRHGRTYHSIYKAGNVGVTGPTRGRSPVYSEYAIKQSAREAAEKILAAFDIKIGNGPWSD